MPTPISATELAESIARYAVRASALESRLLTPMPLHYLYSGPLMDHLVSTGACTLDQIQAWTDSEADQPVVTP